MINFFFKKPKIYIDCFTSNLNAFELFPIQESVNFYPDWWKTLPKTHTSIAEEGIEIQRPTMKSCDGFTALYQKGFMIPLWSDLVIETQQNGYRYRFADDTSDISSHDFNQMSKEFMAYIHFKITSPWRIREKEGIKFLFFQPSYNHIRTLLEWHVVPGMVDFKYQYATNINFLTAKNRRFELSAGLPLVHLVPLTEKEIVVRTHIVDKNNHDEMKLFNDMYPFFSGSYRKIKKIIDKGLK